MFRYISRRVFQSLPLLFGISVILFVMMSNVGDPVSTMGGRQRVSSTDRDRLVRQLGLDQPIYVQYIFWLVGNNWYKLDTDGDGVGDTYGTRLGILRGDLGNSFRERRPAIDVIADRVPATLLLMVSSEIVTIGLALLLGVYSALRPYTRTDNIITALSFILYSMPIFWIALSLLWIFSVTFKQAGLPYLPTVGMYEPGNPVTLLEVARHLILPVLSLSLISVAGYSRYVRAALLEVINADYIRTAYAKGLSKGSILWSHALKNASLPLVTLIGLDLPFLLGGAVVTEQIFAWPGMGQLFVNSLDRADFPVLMGLLMLIAALVVVFQIITDIVYAWLDPRIRLS
ncbi:MAG: ABC transporter permease [Chloroflexota bacterium]